MKFFNNAANTSFKTFYLVFDSNIIQMGLCDFFLNALKIDCFIIKESKYPNYCYNNFLVPLAVDNFFLLQNFAKICKVIRTLLVVADLLFKRPHCPPWDPKKIDKKGEILLRASNFRKKFIPGIFPLTKENISLQCRISVSHAVKGT